MQILTGIYEQVINQVIDNELKEVDLNENIIEKTPIDSAEAQHILAEYLAQVIEKGLIRIREEYKDDSKDAQIKACNEIIAKLSQLSNSEDILEWQIGAEGQQLLAILNKTKQQLKDKRPTTSLAVSTLFTGSKLEPSMVSELKKEIATADSIDMLVSFIKWSGLRLIFDDLQDFTKEHKLRIITTSYMGATDPKALEELNLFAVTTIKQN